MTEDELKQNIHQEIERATVKIVVDGWLMGTGFFITNDGYILTAYHCVRTAADTKDDTETEKGYTGRIEVELKSRETIIASLDESKSSSDNDLAILKVDNSSESCLPLGIDSKVFDDVVALGYPMSRESRYKPIGTYFGKISRFLTNETGIETDAVKGQGHSGSALYHYASKRVIGVISEVYKPENMPDSGIAKQVVSLFKTWPELQVITQRVAEHWDKYLEQLGWDKYLKQLGMNVYHRPEIPLPDLKLFRGRTDQIKKLVDKLNDPSKSPIVITGMGGVGKSFLVYYVVDQLIREGHYPDGQAYINLRDINFLHHRDFLAKLVQTFYPNQNVQEKDEETLYRCWREIIKNKNILLFLDNADIQKIEELIDPETPLFLDGCSVIITSRRVLHLSFLAHCVFLEPMNEIEATSLLVSVANFSQKNRLTDVQAKRIAELCGYLPLALSIAANTLNKEITLTSEQYLQALATEKQRLKQLKLKGRSQSSHVDVEASLNLSLMTLTDDLVYFWSKLGMFVDWFDTFDICITLANQSSTAEILLQCEEELAARGGRLQELVERSLVQFFPKGILSPSEQDDEIKQRRNRNRYRLHDLLRELALLKCPPQEELPLKHIHASYYLSISALAEHRYLQESQIEGLKLFDYKLPNIKEGQAWAAKHFHNDDLSIARFAMRYAYAAPQCLKLRLTTAELTKWLETGVEAAKYMETRLAESSDEFVVFRREQASLLNNLGDAYDVLQQFSKAIACYEESLKISRDIKFEELETACLHNLGVAYLNLGQSSNAIWYIKKALKKIRDKSSDITTEGRCYANLAIAYKERGEIDRAFEYVETALQVASDTENLQAEGERYCIRGNLYTVRGEYDRAMEDFQRALDIFQSAGDLWNEGILLDSMARVSIDKEDYQQAIKYAQEGIEIGTRMNNPRINNECHSALALTYLLLGDLPTARIAIEEARKHNHPTNNLQTTLLHGIIAFGQNDHNLAQRLFSEAIEQSRILIERNPSNDEIQAFKELSLYGLELCTTNSANHKVSLSVDETQPAIWSVKRTQPQRLWKKLRDFAGL